MQLTVVGSSPAWPNPGSAHAGYLLEGRGSLLLDCGPGVVARLRERGGLAIDAIAITHFHLDHWGDLVPWAWLANHGPAGDGRPELWLPPGGAGELAAFAAHWGNEGMFERAFALRAYEPGTPFTAAGFEVEARRVPHYRLDAYGFRVRDTRDGRLLAYSGDSGPGEELESLARGADLFVCEATLASGDRESEPRGHLSADEALAAASGPVLFTHRPTELAAPGDAPVAHDGLVVTI